MQSSLLLIRDMSFKEETVTPDHWHSSLHVSKLPSLGQASVLSFEAQEQGVARSLLPVIAVTANTPSTCCIHVAFSGLKSMSTPSYRKEGPTMSREVGWSSCSKAEESCLSGKSEDARK